MGKKGLRGIEWREGRDNPVDSCTPENEGLAAAGAIPSLYLYLPAWSVHQDTAESPQSVPEGAGSFAASKNAKSEL